MKNPPSNKMKCGSDGTGNDVIYLIEPTSAPQFLQFQSLVKASGSLWQIAPSDNEGCSVLFSPYLQLLHHHCSHHFP